MPIRACAACGSDRLVFPKTGNGPFACEDCGWTGTPQEFPNWSSWQQAREARKAAPVLA